MAKGAFGYGGQVKVIDPPDNVFLQFTVVSTAGMWGQVINGTDTVVRLYPYASTAYPNKQDWTLDSDVLYPGQQARLKPFRGFRFEPDANPTFGYTDAKKVRQSVAGTRALGETPVTAAPAGPPFYNRTGYKVRLYATYNYQIPSSAQERAKDPNFGRGSGVAWQDIEPGGSYNLEFPVTSFELIPVMLEVEGEPVEVSQI